MKKALKIIIVILCTIIIIGEILFLIDFFRVKAGKEAIVFSNVSKLIKKDEEKDSSIDEVIKCVVVKVNKNSITVMKIENDSDDVYAVKINQEDGEKYKKGQEIYVYFDGNVEKVGNLKIDNVKKIEIIKEKSDTKIPEEILKYYYNQVDNVKANVIEITKKGINIEITDSNEIPYKYSKTYSLYKVSKIEDNSSNENISEEEQYAKTNFEYSLIPIEKKKNEVIEDNIEITEKGENKIQIQINWKPYGEISNNNTYEVELKGDDLISISIRFSVDNNGNITAEEPNIG